MTWSSPVLSADYRAAAQVGLMLQIPVALLTLLILDGGGMARLCGVSLLAFWLGAALIAVRRPWSPTSCDVLYWKWGFAGCLLLAGMMHSALC